MRLSIIIPALGSQRSIDETLLSVLENRPHSCQVIVPHAPRYVDPYNLHDEVQFVSSSGEGTSSLCNAAFEAACGEIIQCLLPGMVVNGDWSEAALQRFAENRNIGSLVPTIQSIAGKTNIYGVAYHPRRGKMLVHNREDIVRCPLLGTGFYRLAAIRFMRGFDVRFGELADVELGFRMRSAGYDNVLDPGTRIRSGSVPRVTPQKGYRGGLVRGRLERLAREHDIDGGRPLWRSVLGECLNHGFGVASVAAMYGRLAGQTEDREETPSTTTLPVAAAAKPPHRRAA